MRPCDLEDAYHEGRLLLTRVDLGGSHHFPAQGTRGDELRNQLKDMKAMKEAQVGNYYDHMVDSVVLLYWY